MSAANASAPKPSSSVRCRFDSFEFPSLQPAPGIVAANHEALLMFEKERACIVSGTVIQAVRGATG
jgi:hypothetical protein